MKIKLTLLAVITALILGCSDTSGPPPELSNIEALKAAAAPKINQIRYEGLKETARGLGAQSALAWRSRQINLMLNSHRRNLDHIFNFNYLILNHNVLPPVLAEGRNTLNLSDEFSLRVSDHDFQIVQTPRFITAPPSWRDYLWMAYKKPEVPHETMLPQNSDERKVWNQFIQVGWHEGVDQANAIFSANLNRLRRDFTGMVLYRKLLAQNMVTPPYVSQSDLGVTGGGSDMRINDRILRITAISQLQNNPKHWNPVVTESDKKNLDSLMMQFKKISTTTKDKI